MSENKLKEKYNIDLTRGGIFSQQICIPKDLDPQRAADLVELNSPCGTSLGWHWKDEAIPNGDPAKVQCKDDENKIHIVLFA